MKLARLNLLTALVSLLIAVVCAATGQSFALLIWLVCSLIWLILSIARTGSSATEPRPFVRLMRRVSRLLVWS